MKQIEVRELGFKDYKESWDYQEKLFQHIISLKIDNRRNNAAHITPNYFLFVEHPHVYTLGKSGQSNNMLINEKFLSKINATYFQSDRGGDITYHGPGQIVGYPIFDLDQFKIHLKQYVHSLEECIIIFLKEYGIRASRLEGATGVWLEPSTPDARKICAIGVKASRFITMHGFAFNVNTDLEYFSHINPCGFQDKGVTSLEKELGEKQDIEKIKIRLKDIILTYFQQMVEN